MKLFADSEENLSLALILMAIVPIDLYDELSKLQTVLEGD